MTSRDWLDLFAARVDCSAFLPWEDGCVLSPAEKERIAASVQQFQLGEGSDGSGLLRRARASRISKNDPDFLTALELFIAEEQRHSRHLARFMAQHGIPLLQKHWVDRVFRRVRKLAGLELCLHVLVTAEIVAVPYYHGLSAATNSPLLKAICKQILRDETDHLRYQAENLERLRTLRKPLSRGAEVVLWRLFMLGTLQVVWRDHRKVLRSGGGSYSKFIHECLGLLERVANCSLPADPKAAALSAGANEVQIEKADELIPR